MKFKRSIKVLVLIVLLTLVVFPGTSNLIHAEINTEYYNNMKSSVVSSSMLSSILSSDILIDPIAKLIYSIGSFLEYIVGSIVLAASGMEIFPWADGIVFNAIPMLDVNFITPANESLLSATALQPIIKQLYRSIFMLAQTFFGIAILLMGIKLAISTIASEKAKYKEAVVKWATALVLLFGMQYFISFVFYLNEQLVKVASTIVTDQINTQEFANTLDKSINNLSDEQLVNNFIRARKDWNLSDWLNPANWIDRGVSAITNVIISAATNGNMSVDAAERTLTSNPTIAAALLRDEGFRKASGLDSVFLDNAGGFWDYDFEPASLSKMLLYYMQSAVSIVKDPYINSAGNRVSLSEEKELEILRKNYYNVAENGKSEEIMLARALYNAKKASTGGTVKPSLITNLAHYFKKAAWIVDENGWRPTKAILQNAILYAVLVVQSVILLISYTKRIFYVIVLAIMSPIVVVYDFMKKI